MNQLAKIVDCTLRDGGYYCDWVFDNTLVDNYLNAMNFSGVDIVEIGFRFTPKSKFLGPYAYTTDAFLESLTLPERLTYAVMVNAKDYCSCDCVAAEIRKAFDYQKNSRVSIVRIATTLKELPTARLVVDALIELGYTVFINVMQITNISEEQLAKTSKEIAEWGTVQVLYFADSLGNLTPSDTDNIVDIIGREWAGDLGIHAHNNKERALVNTISAAEAGVRYLDSTILGMGRGAGNASTEGLLVELNAKGRSEYYPDAVFPLALHEFSDLKEKYNWGPNLYYFLSATYGIHPTYIQEMLGETYSTDQILNGVKSLRSGGASLFSLDEMSRAISGSGGRVDGSWSAKDWCRARDVVIIGTGPSVDAHIDQIAKFSRERDAVVLCLNINSVVPVELVSAFVACYETRILVQAAQYSNLGRPLIIPMARVPSEIAQLMESVEIKDYGMAIQDGCFEPGERGCTLPASYAGAYAIALAVAATAKNIFLAGFDGYLREDPRQKKMGDVLELYGRIPDAPPLISLTPTSYEMRTVSPYSPAASFNSEIFCINQKNGYY